MVKHVGEDPESVSSTAAVYIKRPLSCNSCLELSQKITSTCTTAEDYEYMYEQSH